MTKPTAPAWPDPTLPGLKPDDICYLDREYVSDPRSAPWPFMTSGPTLVIDSVQHDPDSPNAMSLGEDDPFGEVVLTPLGPVLRLGYGVYRGKLYNPDLNYADNDYVEQVFGSAEALNAIGASDVVPAW